MTKDIRLHNKFALLQSQGKRDSVCEAWSKSIAQRPRGDRNERVIPAGAEGQEVERKRADEAELKAKRLA